MEINREELVWAAGFFDGEGTTNSRPLSNRGNQPPIISVTQIEKETLERFQAALLGIGTVYGPYGPYGTNKFAWYRWQTSNLADSITACGLLWGFLCEPKRRQMASKFKLHWRSREEKRQA